MKQCSWCGRLNENWGQFCSPKCEADSAKTTMPRCEWCGRLNENWGQFCSPKCKAEWDEAKRRQQQEYRAQKQRQQREAKARKEAEQRRWNALSPEEREREIEIANQRYLEKLRVELEKDEERAARESIASFFSAISSALKLGCYAFVFTFIVLIASLLGPIVAVVVGAVLLFGTDWSEIFPKKP